MARAREAAEPGAKKQVPDAVEAGPLVYRVVIDNDRLRVLSAKYANGRGVPPHTHPDRVVYDLVVGTARFEKAGVHEIDGAAPSAASQLVVEFGTTPGSTVPAGDDPVAKYPTFKLLVDEQRVRVLAVTFGKGTSPPVALGDHVLLAREKGTLVWTREAGAAQTLELEPGEVLFFPAGIYTANNAKKKSFEVVVFELKAP